MIRLNNLEYLAKKDYMRIYDAIDIWAEDKVNVEELMYEGAAPFLIKFYLWLNEPYIPTGNTKAIKNKKLQRLNTRMR